MEVVGPGGIAYMDGTGGRIAFDSNGTSKWNYDLVVIQRSHNAWNYSVILFLMEH